ncbi:hypothetical protein Kpol_1072p41 [Vanderwaltozyma polyspora DSM 70294]|uniref:Uncharacterized protein n=1 Tax=Vanderwaltozyma polyspora (strain ATCC 22028 / DSM 70294 / BCRC 21397 / CBS 2163 / NBRC 10782 / NRRL Y-8283 / UCD 57-17) TaxID=436907 RepID=A7TKQ9_VANPO|nr:uncharacterized protein Kpol_1072p41 [Vanderwaltozyma polyspora DSM 70294]EDO17171.1 hypothetical protein Kpol_1072p41 [Vanderwaltozyma polyspora DSM 70294]
MSTYQVMTNNYNNDYHLQTQTLVIPDTMTVEEDIQQRIDLARQETKHLYAQIDKVKMKVQDADLCQMAKSVKSLNSDALNLKPTLTLKGHNNKIADFRWSQDSKNLLSASQDGFMLVWDSETGLKKNAIPLDSQWVLSCAISPSGNLVASAGLNNNCTVYRVSKEARVQQSIVSIFKGHTCYISDVEFLDNSKIVTASGDMTCALWDIPKAKRVREYADHLGDVLSISLPPAHTENSANLFASSGSDGYTYIWDVRSAASVQSFFVSNSDVNTVKFFKDGNSIVTGSDDGTLRMFDLRADCPIATYSLNKTMTNESQTYSSTTTEYGQKSPTSPSVATLNSSYLDNQGVMSLDFSASGRLMFACYTDIGVLVWDILKAEIVGKLEGHSNRVSNIRTSPDGLAVCTGSWDSTMKVWSPNYV